MALETRGPPGGHLRGGGVRVEWVEGSVVVPVVVVVTCDGLAFRGRTVHQHLTP